MNSTTFHTLTEFVKYLGRTGKCRVDETEKGWFISLIQEDPMEKLSTDRRLKRDRCVLSRVMCWPHLTDGPQLMALLCGWLLLH